MLNNYPVLYAWSAINLNTSCLSLKWIRNHEHRPIRANISIRSIFRQQLPTKLIRPTSYQIQINPFRRLPIFKLSIVLFLIAFIRHFFSHEFISDLCLKSSTTSLFNSWYAFKPNVYHFFLFSHSANQAAPESIVLKIEHNNLFIYIPNFYNCFDEESQHFTGRASGTTPNKYLF